ncbi:magnesium transporter protein 1-like [Choloepus didactylus]|uniref:magnesium transporter protein 1-like n=1 Tax=Choloepus didactylus TaxID=27675 RepID=UPI00189D4A9A|nr:magnesium transporter protein 1-like [Choloepus didactylus]
MCHRFILDPPRNYYVIVMFTALQEFRLCGNCKQAAEEFQILANSWEHLGAFNKIFFAMVDYDECPKVFGMFQVKSVPTFLHFPAKRQFTVDDIYCLKERGIGAEQIAEWVVERTNVSIRIRRPASYHDLFMLGILLALIGGLVYLLKWNRKFIFSKTFWAVFALCFVTVMTAGEMWTRIEAAPYAERNPHTGQMHYIHRMYYSQFVGETYIISLLNMCITLGMVILDKAATSRMNFLKRKMMCMIGMCLVVIFFSWLLSLFRYKEPGYPYSFLMD